MSKTKDIVGEVLNDTYRLTRKLDQGGMGAVYEAVHARLKRKRFAIKVLRPEAAEAKELFARFRREAEITSELGHPHIVNVIDFHETEDGRQYMVMEFLEGENMGDRLRRAGPLAPRELHRLMEQVASGLQAAHDKDIVHRDMKPENIFLVDTGTDKPLAKVLDFGISKIRHSALVLTRDHSLLGSPFYMSPEQASGLVKTIDHYTDIFAMGSICYHGLTGKMPFEAPTLQGVIYQVVHHQQEPVTAHNPSLPDAFDRVISKAMAKKMEDRYDSVTELVKALGQAVDHEGAGDSPVSLQQLGLAETAASVLTGPPAPIRGLDADDLATGDTMLGPTGEGTPEREALDATQDSAAMEAGAPVSKKSAPGVRQPIAVVSAATGEADAPGPQEDKAEDPTGAPGSPEHLRHSTYSSATGEHVPAEPVRGALPQSGGGRRGGAAGRRRRRHRPAGAHRRGPWHHHAGSREARSGSVCTGRPARGAAIPCAGRCQDSNACAGNRQRASSCGQGRDARRRRRSSPGGQGQAA